MRRTARIGQAAQVFVSVDTQKSIILHHKCQCFKHLGVLMTYKALFWSIYVAFCTFCASFASLCLIKHLFTRPQIKVRPKGLHRFAFCILIFDFPVQSLTPRPQSLIPNPQSLTPNPQSLTPRPQSLTPNPWLINDLRSTKTYVRKNKLFMQNKANFQKVKLNVNRVLTKDYDQLDTWSIRKTKPIQSQLKPIQSQFKANSKPIKANSNPIQSQYKPNSCLPSVWPDRGKGGNLFDFQPFSLFSFIKRSANFAVFRLISATRKTRFIKRPRGTHHSR